jgi:hypothetical protein
MKTHDVDDGKGNTTTYRDNDDNTYQPMNTKGDGCSALFGVLTLVIIIVAIL